MKFGKGTLAALHNSSMSDAGSAGSVSGTAVTWALLLYKGTVPTFAEFTAAMNSPNFRDTSTTNREPYLNYQDLAVARSADYLGGVSGRTKFDTALQDWNKLEARLNVAAIGGSTPLNATGSPRLTYIVTEGVPTWYLLVACNATYINLQTPMSGDAASVVFGAMGTVGDETSSADLRIKGGKVYANSTTQTDQSRSLNLANLSFIIN